MSNTGPGAATTPSGRSSGAKHYPSATARKAHSATSTPAPVAITARRAATPAVSSAADGTSAGLQTSVTVKPRKTRGAVGQCDSCGGWVKLVNLETHAVKTCRMLKLVRLSLASRAALLTDIFRRRGRRCVARYRFLALFPHLSPLYRTSYRNMHTYPMLYHPVTPTRGHI